jgi:CheY-like chemotaxis protein
VPRILVADDNTNIQKMVSLAFEERGIDVVSVGNGEAAVRRIPDLNPDLVLADVFMPVRNGYEVCEFVKKDDRFSHVPVILLVGAFDPLDEKEARRVGADGVLKKPFVPPDPLIAMVTSALEKNPKVAAEMAKAREAAAAPPAPEPVAPVLEAPARMEPKPLPEFPEPTAEEAAQIYGFGKGVRSTDDEEVPADDEREAPKSLKAPKATAKQRHAEEDDEDDADAMTAHDWRRNAGNFEVPDEPGGRLAFNPDTDFSPITFPSEREVPPKHISAAEFEEDEPVETSKLRHDTAEVEAAVDTKPALREESPTEAVADSKTIAFPEPPAVSVLSVNEAEPVVAVERDTTTATPEPPAPPAANENLPEPDPQSTQAPKSKIGAWMDAMTSPSEYSEGGWLSSIFGHRSENKAAPKQKQEINASDRSPDRAVAETTPQASSQIDATDHVHQREEQQIEEPQFETVRPMAREPLPAENSLELSAPELKASPVSVPPDSPGPDAPEPESWFAPPPPPVLRDASESKPVLALTTTSQTDREFIAPPPDDSGSRRDPYLEEPASAARVVPEPLLVRDDAEPNEVSRFSRATEQPSALHSFFAPASGDPVTEDSVGHDDPAHHEEFNAPIFAPPAETESPSAEVTERIPTGPPPNREALADIPFLMPPPPPPFEPASENQKKDSAQVDAVVAKVLEKLGPQLHELLSQSLLKPLVENLLQQELEKKGK